MPTEIVADIEFTEPLFAPDGDDFMNDAADVIQLITQVLANRVAYVRDHTLLSRESTTLDPGTLTINPANAVSPLLKTDNPPATGNPWARLGEFPLDASGGRKAMLFYGSDANIGSLAIVINAFWSNVLSPNGKWVQQNSTKESSALIITPTGAFFSVQSSGHAAWEFWPNNLGDLTVGANILCGSQVVAGSHIIGGGEVRFPGSAKSGGEYRYTTSRTRTSIVPMSRISGDYARTGTGGVKSPSGNDVAWLVRVPRDASYGRIEIKHTKTNTSATTFRLRERTGGSWVEGSAVAPTDDDLLSASGATLTTVGIHVTAIDASGLSGIDPDESELELVWHRPSGATDDEVHQIRMVDWTDAGPRSEVL